MSTSIRLSPEIWQRLDVLASGTGRSKAYHLREFIEHGFEDIEDYYLAAEVLARIRSGEEDMMKADDFRRGDVYR